MILCFYLMADLCKCCDCLFLESTEEGSERLAARFDPCASEYFDKFPLHGALDLQGTDGWGDLPDVAESHAGEVAAPAGGNWDAVDGCSDDVAERFPQIETFVRELPNAVYGFSMARLTNNLLE